MEGIGESKRALACARASEFPVDADRDNDAMNQGIWDSSGSALANTQTNDRRDAGTTNTRSKQGTSTSEAWTRSCSRCVLYHLFSLLTCRPSPTSFSFCVHLCDFKINRLWSKVSAHVQVTILPGGIFLPSRERLGYHVIRLSIHTMWVCVCLSTHAMVSYNYEMKVDP